ncbi:MAG: GNAT family N-acetyltransferase [Planctomycetota bacterium]
MSDNELRIRLAQAEASDLQALSAMNRALIEDEGSRNSMSAAELEQRMAEWLANGWRAALFELDEATVGYALFEMRRDEYDDALEEAYIRQFYIDRSRRRTGIGAAAFDRLRSELFPKSATISLEVLAANHGAYCFWRRLGLAPYCTTLKLSGDPAS